MYYRRMAKDLKPTKKQLNHLLTLGTLMLANKELIKLVGELREKYRINPLENEWNPSYKDELAANGKLQAIEEEITASFANSYIEDEDVSKGSRELARILSAAKDEKAKDVWEMLWPTIAEGLKQGMENMLGDMTVKEALETFGLSSMLGDIGADELAEFVVTDKLPMLPSTFTGGIYNALPNYVIAIAGPLTLQDEIVENFKQDIRKKFPAVFRTTNSRIAAACLAYHNMGLTDKEIALKLYNLNPDRKDFDSELSRKENLVRKNRERVKKQLDSLK